MVKLATETNPFASEKMFRTPHKTFQYASYDLKASHFPPML